MKELSLHILDIAQNSLKAGASRVGIDISETPLTLKITVSDDGCGMSPELLARVTDPFTTTRTTRKVGLGIPLFKLAAEQTGGSLEIDSEPGRGTTLRAVFTNRHIDLPPLGDIPSTIVSLVQGSPGVDFVYRHSSGDMEFELDTSEVRARLDGVPLDEPEVLEWIAAYVRDGEDGFQITDGVTFL